MHREPYTYRTYMSLISSSAPSTFLPSMASNSQHVGKIPMTTSRVPCPLKSRYVRNEPVQTLLMMKPAPQGRKSHYSREQKICNCKPASGGDDQNKFSPKQKENEWIALAC